MDDVHQIDDCGGRDGSGVVRIRVQQLRQFVEPNSCGQQLRSVEHHRAECDGANAIDRVAYGAVVDFALFHVQIGGNTFNWYVFNVADVAIVAGVAALLYDSFLGLPAAKAP